MLASYRTINREAESTTVLQKSRFIGLATPIRAEDDAKAIIERIRTAHPEASHHAYAYRIGDRDEVQRASDDGEPSGTAGRPILEVLEREDAHYSLIVVTRYFGGTLLGAGGLVRAYAGAASAAVHEAGVVTKTLHQELLIEVDYGWFGKLEYELPRSGYALEHIHYTEKVAITIHVPIHRVEDVRAWVTDLTSGQATTTPQGELYK